jgi:hypothetical protein
MSDTRQSASEWKHGNAWCDRACSLPTSSVCARCGQGPFLPRGVAPAMPNADRLPPVPPAVPDLLPSDAAGLLAAWPVAAPRPASPRTTEAL